MRLFVCARACVGACVRVAASSPSLHALFSPSLSSCLCRVAHKNFNADMDSRSLRKQIDDLVSQREHCMDQLDAERSKIKIMERANDSLGQQVCVCE